MKLPTYFTDFLSEIGLKQHHIDDLKRGHTTLRERLRSDPALAPIIVSDFLQGSYRRSTAIKPKGDRRADVAVIVVTRLDREAYTPEEAMQQFVPFLDRYYEKKYHFQGRSIGIELSYVDLDLVITSAPSERMERVVKSESVRTDDALEEVADWRLTPSWIGLESRRQSADASILLCKAQQEPVWKTEPLWIPDRDANCWEPTHPLAQIEWTSAKNARCNTYYVPLVKALKWWWREQHQNQKYPKGYPLEHLIGQSCPDGIDSVAEGVTATLEDMAQRYLGDVALHQIPILPDHGVPEHDVLHRLSVDDFANFHAQVCQAALLARQAFDASEVEESARLWSLLFGKAFPYDGNKGTTTNGGFTLRTQPTRVTGGRFA